MTDAEKRYKFCQDDLDRYRDRENSKGRTAERQEWENEGHSKVGPCQASSNHRICALADATVETEVSKPSDVTSILTRSMKSTAVQTMMELGADSRIPEPSKPFSWADDAASIPVFCRNPPPRDLSVLRSGSTANPFGTLQHRYKRALYVPRNRRATSHFVSSPLPLPLSTRPPLTSRVCHHPSRIAPNSASMTVLHIDPLDWNNDPRLCDLSRALTALGWVRPC